MGLALFEEGFEVVRHVVSGDGVFGAVDSGEALWIGNDAFGTGLCKACDEIGSEFGVGLDRVDVIANSESGVGAENGAGHSFRTFRHFSNLVLVPRKEEGFFPHPHHIQRGQQTSRLHIFPLCPRGLGQ